MLARVRGDLRRPARGATSRPLPWKLSVPESQWFAIAMLVGATILGGLPVIVRRPGTQGLHLFVAFAAGLFLGALFLHLLPELTAPPAAIESAAEHDGHDHGDHDHAHDDDHAGHDHDFDRVPWFAALGGLLGMFFLEQAWLAGRAVADQAGSERRHSVLLLATVVGLSLHAFVTGIGLAGVEALGAGASPFLIGFSVHKATEGFSLATVARLAHRATPTVVALVVGFALVTPAGLWLGLWIMEAAPRVQSAMIGVSVGTFLYMSVGHLLPEVFHDAKHRSNAVSAVVLLLGVLAAFLSIPHPH